MESKWRLPPWLWPNDVPEDKRAGLVTRTINTRDGRQVTQYRAVNEEIYSEVNTILKMGKKRSLVDAALSVGRLSEIFTQDLDERPQAAEVVERWPNASAKTQRTVQQPSQHWRGWL